MRGGLLLNFGNLLMQYTARNRILNHLIESYEVVDSEGNQAREYHDPAIRGILCSHPGGSRGHTR